jgi:glucosylceramidase
MIRPLCLLLLLAIPALAQVRVVVSSRAGERLHERAPVSFGASSGTAPAITVNAERHYQTMDGFGATLTESAAMVLAKLPAAKQESVLRSLFDANSGAGYSLVKSPLAAFDFAAAGPWFSYNDTPGDVQMKKFSIERDLRPYGLVNLIKKARKYGSFRIQSTMDYPPDWMLDQKMSLKREYFDACARYQVAYLKAYRDQGVPIDFLAPFNEPQYVYCKIRYDEIRDYIRDHLGPMIEAGGLKTKLQVSDPHNRQISLKESPKVLDDPKARRFISTIPAHGYLWDAQGSEALGKLHAMYPDIPVWQTEVCYAYIIDKRPMPVHGYDDGDRWGRMIMSDVNNWAAGWIYWNIILDQNGGPWLISEPHGDPVENDQHPVVTVHTDTGEIEYTGLYYYLAHFSRFVRPGSVRVGAEGKIPGLSFAAFEDKDGSRILEVINSSSGERKFAIRDGARAASAALPPWSIGTYIWRR